MSEISCDAWLAAGALGRARPAFCCRDAGHESERPHYGDGATWIDEVEHARRGPWVPDPALVSLRKLITDTADAYAAREDQVVVLDDVVADEIAAAIAERYGIAR